MNTTTNAPLLENLKENFNGQIIMPEDPEYNEARKLYNGMIDKRPGIIMKCTSTEDVVQAVNFGRSENSDISVRSGGHNGAGLGLCNDGIAIDLSPMKSIQVNPQEKIAKIGAGCTLGDIDKVTHEYGLALPGGIISTTGIGGLTLGGGIGYLTRKGGLTIDHLLEAEMVLATGEVVIANKNGHPDLFWALRGAGGNFGVVTSFTFDLIPVKNVYAGPMFWPLSQAKMVMKFYDKLMKESSNDLYGFFAFLTIPPAAPFPEEFQMQRVCGIVWNYTGPMEKAPEVFEPIRAFGTPIVDFVGNIPVPALNTMFDTLYPPGHQWYWKADYFDELTDDCIDVMIEHGEKVPTVQSTMHLYPVDGKAHEISRSETAWHFRDARWAQVIVGVDPDPENRELITGWCQNYWEATHAFSMGGAYINFMMEEGPERIKATYGKNYERLTQIKAKYDPDNLFHVNQNIKPEAVEPEAVD